jgi:acyl carrier protein
MTRAFACDVTDRSALERTLAAIDDTMPPLRGVVHAAMVIDDGLVRDLDATRIERVFAPKVQGALNLNALTATQTLDFFVLYSSATTLFGNPGQASYVAANRFLERLAESRRALGLPAVCVAWGAIDDAGYLARNETIKSALQSRMGGSALRAQEALDALEKLLLDDRSGVGVLDYDWLALQRHLPVAGSPRFSELARTADDEGADGGDLEEIHRLVNELPEAELSELFIEMLKKEVGEILHLSAERIEAHRSVYDLGMDSLMGMELVVAVESRFGVTLPVMALSEGPTIAQIVTRIVRQLKAPGGETPTGSDVEQTMVSIAAQHGEEVSSSLVTSVASAVEASDADDRGLFIR